MDLCLNQTDAEHKGRGDRAPVSLVTQDDWVQLYTSRILRAWFHQAAPLGLAYTYANWIRSDLAKAYGHPLTRAFIEETY
jgi:hypothetical protein